MTYATLQAEIAEDLMRQDLGAVIPRFIRDGESRINKRIRHREMETSTTLEFDFDDFDDFGLSGAASLPADFLEAKSLMVFSFGQRFLEQVEPDSAEFLFRHRPSQPQYYAILGNQIVTRPSYDGEGMLTYYRRVPALSGAAPTNWLRDRFPEVYRYAALIEGAIYLRDPALEASYLARFEEAAGSVLTDNRLARATRGETVPPTPAAETREQMRAP